MRHSLFIRDMKKAQGLQSNRRAAAGTGISQATFHRVTHGGKMDLETFEKLCRWLKQPASRYLS